MSKINSLIVCPCLLDVGEMTAGEGNKYQKGSKKALNVYFRL